MGYGALKIGRRTMEVSSIAQASAVYSCLRDEAEARGEGGSKFPSGKIAIDGQTYRVSYNGKVWADKEWEPGDVPVFNPYAAKPVVGTGNSGEYSDESNEVPV